MGNPHRGDLGVPHSVPEQSVKTWTGCYTLASGAAFNPWRLAANRLNWQDKVMKFEQNSWKKVMKEKQS